MALPDVAKRQAFVRHYVVSGNATRAAIAVGCSPKLASVTASRWLRNGDVLALLASRLTCISVTWSLEHSTPFASWWRVKRHPLRRVWLQ